MQELTYVTRCFGDKGDVEDITEGRAAGLSPYIGCTAFCRDRPH